MDVKHQTSISLNQATNENIIPIEDIIKHKDKQIETLTNENIQFQKDIIKLNQKLNYQMSSLSPVLLNKYKLIE